MRVEAYNIHYIKQTKVWDITGQDGIGKLMGYQATIQAGTPNDDALCANIYPDPVQVNIPVDDPSDIDAIIEETIVAVEKETLQKVETLSVRF